MKICVICGEKVLSQIEQIEQILLKIIREFVAKKKFHADFADLSKLTQILLFNLFNHLICGKKFVKICVICGEKVLSQIEQIEQIEQIFFKIIREFVAEKKPTDETD